MAQLFSTVAQRHATLIIMTVLWLNSVHHQELEEQSTMAASAPLV
jgi:hypothetical protein